MKVENLCIAWDFFKMTSLSRMTIFLAKIRDLEICILSSLALNACNKNICAKVAYFAKSICIKNADIKGASTKNTSIKSICAKSACT